MADTQLRLVPHPRSVSAHILGQSCRSRPCVALGRGTRKHRLTPGELWRDFNKRLVDEHGNRVEIARVRFETKTLRFERDRATARERVKDCRRFVVSRAHDLSADLVEEVLIVEVVPVDHLDDQVEEALPLLLHSVLGPRFGVLVALAFRLGTVVIDEVARVIHQLSEEHRTGGRERPASPP